jgi:hypothetical protein
MTMSVMINQKITGGLLTTVINEILKQLTDQLITCPTLSICFNHGLYTKYPFLPKSFGPGKDSRSKMARI